MNMHHMNDYAIKELYKHYRMMKVLVEREMGRRKIRHEEV